MTLRKGQLVIGDAEGGVYQIDSRGNAQLLWKEVAQPITALSAQSGSERLAIGYKHGLVVALQADLRKAKELSGHVSPVTCLAFRGSHLYSSSFDGHIYRWPLHDDPTTAAALVYEGEVWLHTFVISQDEQDLIIGDEKGNLSRVVVDPQRMADQIYQRLERNFTPEEWNLYIGEVSAYETYLSK